MRYVKYVGLSHRRMISAADWRSVGITGDTVVWSAQNGFAVPLDSLTEEQVQKAIDPDQGFVITGDEDFKPEPKPLDMTPAQATQTVETPLNVVDVLEGRQTVSRDDSGAAKVSPRTTEGGSPTGGSPR